MSRQGSFFETFEMDGLGRHSPPLWEIVGKIKDAPHKFQLPCGSYGRITSTQENSAKMDGVVLDVHKKESEAIIMGIE